MQRGKQVAFGEIKELHARLVAERVVIPVVGDDAPRQRRDGLGDKVEHVGPHPHLQVARGDELMQPGHMAGKMAAQADALDLGAAARALAEVE